MKLILLTSYNISSIYLRIYTPKHAFYQQIASILNKQRILNYKLQCKTNLNTPHYEKSFNS